MTAGPAPATKQSWHLPVAGWRLVKHSRAPSSGESSETRRRSNKARQTAKQGRNTRPAYLRPDVNHALGDAGHHRHHAVRKLLHSRNAGGRRRPVERSACGNPPHADCAYTRRSTGNRASEDCRTRPRAVPQQPAEHTAPNQRAKQTTLTAGARLASPPSSLSAPARACHFRPCSVPASSRPAAALVAWLLIEATRAAPAAAAASRTALTFGEGDGEQEEGAAIRFRWFAVRWTRPAQGQPSAGPSWLVARGPRQHAPWLKQHALYNDWQVPTVSCSLPR